MAALASALCVICIMAPLFVTSFKTIHNRMTAQSWKCVQLLAYPFFMLIFAHILLFIGSSSLHGDIPALLNVIIYAAVLFTYTILRIRKALREKSARKIAAKAG